MIYRCYSQKTVAVYFFLGLVIPFFLPTGVVSGRLGSNMVAVIAFLVMLFAFQCGYVDSPFGVGPPTLCNQPSENEHQRNNHSI
jgi:hypothetical protein